MSDPAIDHGLLYGDGLFETLRVYNGRFFRLDAHLERLERSAAQLDLRLAWSRGELESLLAAKVAEAGLRDAAVRLTVTRGLGPPVPDPTLCPRPSLLITTRSLPPTREAAWVCFEGTHPTWLIPAVKSTSYQPFLLARHRARVRGFDEALLTVREEVVEGATTNVFTVVEGGVWTPPLESGCLPGITREVIRELCLADSIQFREAPLKKAAFLANSEVFLSSSLAEILPVVEIEGHKVGAGGPGPITLRLAAAYQRLVRAECGP